MFIHPWTTFFEDVSLQDACGIIPFRHLVGNLDFVFVRFTEFNKCVFGKQLEFCFRKPFSDIVIQTVKILKTTF